jgi:hypothetical protein
LSPLTSMVQDRQMSSQSLRVRMFRSPLTATLFHRHS